MEIQLEPIGIIHSCLNSLEICPLQEAENAPEALVKIFANYADGVKDIKAGDEIIILTWLHKADRKELETHPRNDPNTPLTGVFSTRSPNRPNPIGIHFVKVIAILPDYNLQIDGLEVLNGTPVLDIKPA